MFAVYFPISLEYFSKYDKMLISFNELEMENYFWYIILYKLTRSLQILMTRWCNLFDYLDVRWTILTSFICCWMIYEFYARYIPNKRSLYENVHFERNIRIQEHFILLFYLHSYILDYFNYSYYNFPFFMCRDDIYPNPALAQDMTLGQFLSGV